MILQNFILVKEERKISLIWIFCFNEFIRYITICQNNIRQMTLSTNIDR